MTVCRTAFLLAFASTMLANAGAHGGMVTYDFIEGTGNSQKVGAILVLSGAVSSTSGWTMTNGDVTIQRFKVVDRYLNWTGFYTGTIVSPLASLNGSVLTSGAISGISTSATAISNMSQIPLLSQLKVTPRFGSANLARSVYGQWTAVSAAVPEPSCLVLSGVAILVGVGQICCRRVTGHAIKAA